MLGKVKDVRFHHEERNTLNKIELILLCVCLPGAGDLPLDVKNMWECPKFLRAAPLIPHSSKGEKTCSEYLIAKEANLRESAIRMYSIFRRFKDEKPSYANNGKCVFLHIYQFHTYSFVAQNALHSPYSPWPSWFNPATWIRAYTTAAEIPSFPSFSFPSPGDSPDNKGGPPKNSPAPFSLPAKGGMLLPCVVTQSLSSDKEKTLHCAGCTNLSSLLRRLLRASCVQGADTTCKENIGKKPRYNQGAL